MGWAGRRRTGRRPKLKCPKCGGNNISPGDDTSGWCHVCDEVVAVVRPVGEKPEKPKQPIGIKEWTAGEERVIARRWYRTSGCGPLFLILLALASGLVQLALTGRSFSTAILVGLVLAIFPVGWWAFGSMFNRTFIVLRDGAIEVRTGPWRRSAPLYFTRSQAERAFQTTKVWKEKNVGSNGRRTYSIHSRTRLMLRLRSGGEVELDDHVPGPAASYLVQEINRALGVMGDDEKGSAAKAP